jgi:hypothetical protein
VNHKPNKKAVIKEKITPDTLLEGVVLAVAVYLAIKVFEPLFTVAFFVAIGVGLYLAVRNRETLIQKLSDIKDYFNAYL